MTDDHDDTRLLISAADPARSLPPLRNDDLHRRMETAMTTTTTTDRTHRRAWILAGAGGAIAAAAIAIPLALGPASSSTPLKQVDGGGAAAMCAMVTAENIALGENAFRAEVTGVDGQTVTLRVTERFQGDISDNVTTTQGDSAPIDGGPLVFESGQAYLITTRDGIIAACGLSGLDTPELDALYDEAFGR